MLYTLERANVLLLPICAVVFAASLEFPLDWAAWLAMIASSLLLAQGTYYWKVKLDSLLHREDRFMACAPRFRTFSKTNPWWLAAVGVVILAARLTIPVPAATVSLTVFFYLLAIAEHVNYFHWQLMHDNLPDIRRLIRTGIRRSQLWHDLRREERRSNVTQ